MRQLLMYFRDQFRRDFRPDLYAAIALFLAALISLNYRFNLEKGVIDAYQGKWLRTVLYFLLYGTAYFGAVWLWTYFQKRPDVWRNRFFWQHSLFGLAIYSFGVSFTGYGAWSQHVFDGKIYLYAYRCFSNLQTLFTIALPLGLYYRFIDREPTGFYGLKPKRAGMSVYLILLLLMIPVITIASFQPDFQAAYPRYKDTSAATVLGVPNWATALFYELCYGWDFVPTELLFRGFLVIGLSRVLGNGAILPMVVMYATIHFGKPIGETLSSILGGYVLGVLALYTRSIWGGLLIHLGVAWGMELAAFLQKLAS
jgi:ABC-type tungstate transport system substrate-binding protein